MVVAELLLGVAVNVVAIVLFSLVPMYLAVKFLGGETTLMRVLGTDLAVVVSAAVLMLAVPFLVGMTGLSFAGILSTILVVVALIVCVPLVYAYSFQLTYWRAILAMILRAVVAAVIVFVLSLILNLMNITLAAMPAISSLGF